MSNFLYIGVVDLYGKQHTEAGNISFEVSW